MNLLAVDTSTDKAMVSLALQGEIQTVEQEGMRRHAECLLPMIARLLADADCSLAQLDGIVLGRGPGSFTGLRVAAGVVKGLAYASDLPVFPVSGLLAIANEVRFQEKITSPVLAVIDARMGELYWGGYANDGIDTLEQVSAPLAVSWQDVPSFVLAGVGFESYAASFSDVLQQSIQRSFRVFPETKAMIRLVQNGSILPVSAAFVLPMYVRNDVAHEKGEKGG